MKKKLISLILTLIQLSVDFSIVAASISLVILRSANKTSKLTVITVVSTSLLDYFIRVLLQGDSPFEDQVD